MSKNYTALSSYHLTQKDGTVHALRSVFWTVAFGALEGDRASDSLCATFSEQGGFLTRISFWGKMIIVFDIYLFVIFCFVAFYN